MGEVQASPKAKPEAVPQAPPWPREPDVGRWGAECGCCLLSALPSAVIAGVWLGQYSFSVHEWRDWLLAVYIVVVSLPLGYIASIALLGVVAMMFMPWAMMRERARVRKIERSMFEAGRRWSPADLRAALSTGVGTLLVEGSTCVNVGCVWWTPDDVLAEAKERGEGARLIPAAGERLPMHAVPGPLGPALYERYVRQRPDSLRLVATWTNRREQERVEADLRAELDVRGAGLRDGGAVAIVELAPFEQTGEADEDGPEEGAPTRPTPAAT